MILNTDQKKIPTEATISQIEIGYNPCYVLILRDVNDRYEAQKMIDSLRDETEYLKDEIQSLYHLVEIIGESKPFRKTLQLVAEVAPTDSTVLIYGETGTPVVEKTMQYVEITPDTNSGAYYGYNLHQTLIVFKYRQRKVLISLSRQADVSSVGKKGYVLGKDDDWDYFYSNKKGLTLPALGWVSSYIYGSGAINIYYEIDPGSPKVRCAMFKWLRAGWSGINMVQRKHIYKGLKRFARPFKEIIEYPSLPPVEVLASDFSQIRKFSDDALRAKMDIYSNILKRRYIGDNHNGKKWLPKLLADKDHWSGMSREEMESALVIEYMKAVIGKTPNADIEKLLEF